jgi:hypothetical protein
MPDWSLIGGQRGTAVGVSTSTSVHTQVNSGGSAHTKSAVWVELTASTPHDADGIWIVNSQAGSIDVLYDIAIGGSGSEVIICANLGSSSGTGIAIRNCGYYFPITIPAGTRLSAKTQSTTSAQTIRIGVTLFQGGFQSAPGLSRVTTYGADTSDSGGVSVDAGGSTNTKGTYSVITASSTNPIRALVFYIGNQANTARTAANILLDISIGAASSEQVVLSNIPIQGTSTEDALAPQVSPPLPIFIPAGTRITARAQCSINTAVQRAFDVILYGVD